jgi:anthranilate phosphoribosyltransferase
MSVREALRRAAAREEVPAPILERAFGEVMDGRAEPLAVAGLLVALRTKGETVGEIVAAARAMRARAERAPLLDPGTVDTCGTGGDGLGTFNISTAAAFVAAGAGIRIAKHGNRAASSASGSFDVLEALGVRADLPIPVAARMVSEIGIGFLYARRAHPAMRHLAPIREALQLRTVMNCLGPLLNPLGVRRQLVGVYAAELIEPVAGALAELGVQRALVVHGMDGLDELSTTAPSEAARLEEGAIERVRIDAAELGLPRARLEDLSGGNAAYNAEIIRAVLAGEAGPARDIVLLNAAAALWVGGAVPDLEAGLQRAAQSVASGAARAKLEALIEATRRVAA